MRYGIVRSSPDLPSASLQRDLIALSGSDVVLEEANPTVQGRRGLFQLLMSLKRDDIVLVFGLETFALTTGELARLLRQFLESGVTLQIVGGPRPESLVANGAIPRVLDLLVAHEARCPTRSRGRRRSDRLDASLPAIHDPQIANRSEVGSAEAMQGLTQHQLRFAREMRRRGHSLRAIGLLFRLSPKEIYRFLNRVETHVADEVDSSAVVRTMAGGGPVSRLDPVDPASLRRGCGR